MQSQDRIMMIALALVINFSNAQALLGDGDTFADCEGCPKMVVIPAGKYIMGSAPDVPRRFIGEGPQHEVSIKRFAAGQFTVTRGEWKKFVAETNRKVSGGCAWSALRRNDIGIWELNPDASWQNLGFEQDDIHPVVCVSWPDVIDYISWLSRKTGKDYRLLSEAEWEYAARAGSTKAYHWGDLPSRSHANYGSDTTFGFFASGQDKWLYTSPVNAFPPNKFGLYDMHGNVMQFVSDCFSSSYEHTPRDGSPYEDNTEVKMSGRFASMNGTNACDYRMLRGGDYGNPPGMIRSASRNWAPVPGITLDRYRSAGLGFRVARSIE